MSEYSELCVCEMCKNYKNLESENQRLREALENIRKHYEYLEPKTYRQLSAWVIAHKALLPEVNKWK